MTVFSEPHPKPASVLDQALLRKCSGNWVRFAKMRRAVPLLVYRALGHLKIGSRRSRPNPYSLPGAFCGVRGRRLACWPHGEARPGDEADVTVRPRICDSVPYHMTLGCICADDPLWTSSGRSCRHRRPWRVNAADARLMKHDVESVLSRCSSFEDR